MTNLRSQKVKEPKQKRMDFMHKITRVLTGSRFYFHSLVPCLLAVSLAFYICLVGTSTVEAEDQKRVLILHSYHIGYLWTDNVSEGITSVLNKEENVEIIYEHMDTKRYVDKHYLKKLLHIYKYKYSGAIPDVIICSDDNALNFLLKNRDELFTSVPIVFCGINNFTDSRIAGHKNITGVVENPDVLGTLRIALRLHPGTRQVAVVHDQTKSAIANIERLRKIAPDFEKQVEFKYLTDMTISELREALHALPSETVVLHLTFARDRAGVFLPLKQASKLVNDNFAGPVYTCWDVRMSYTGHCGGKVVSGRMQGETAAQMAWQILHGESTDSINIVRESPNVYMFDYEQVKRFKIKSSLLPKGSIIINKPLSFYSEHTGLIWSIIGITASLLVIILFLSVNIIQRKQAEDALRASRDYLEKLTNSMWDAVFSVKMPERVIEWANDSFILTGYEPGECVGKDTAFLFSDKDNFLDFDNKLKNAMAAGKDVLNTEQLLKRKSGETFPAEITVSFHKENDEVVSITSIVRDITERIQTKKELEKHREHLEELVEKRTKELKEKTDKIEESRKALTYLVKNVNEAGKELRKVNMEYAAANKELTEFAYIVSHDLKAPLRAISQLTHWISEDYSEAFDDNGKMQMDLIIKRVKRMDGLIDGILRYSRVGRIREKEKHLDLNLLVNEVIDNIAPPDNIQIIFENKLPVVFRDSIRMEQVFQNLIGNAIKFMDKGEGIIKVGCADKGAYWKFSVSDNGPGIDKRYHDKIFRIFQTLTPRDAHESTGIGLTLIKKIIGQYGGSVSIESEAGHGATFFFTLPKKGEKDEKL